MECPPGCPARVYSLMRECWQWEATKRPSFRQMHYDMENMFQVIAARGGYPPVVRFYLCLGVDFWENLPFVLYNVMCIVIRVLVRIFSLAAYHVIIFYHTSHNCFATHFTFKPCFRVLVPMFSLAAYHVISCIRNLYFCQTMFWVISTFSNWLGGPSLPIIFRHHSHPNKFQIELTEVVSRNHQSVKRLKPSYALPQVVPATPRYFQAKKFAIQGMIHCHLLEVFQTTECPSQAHPTDLPLLPRSSRIAPR